MDSIWSISDNDLWQELRKAQRLMVHFRDVESDLDTSDMFAERVTRLYEEIKKRGLENSEPFGF